MVLSLRIKLRLRFEKEHESEHKKMRQQPPLGWKGFVAGMRLLIPN
jgi:hypothetical protein